MPHFENMDAMRGPPVLAKNLMRNIGKRDQLAWKHVELIRKPLERQARGQGPDRAGDIADRARESGVDGVLISNHGGRQLDHTVSGLRTLLPEIAAEAGGMTVIAIRGGCVVGDVPMFSSYSSYTCSPTKLTSTSQSSTA